MGNEKIIAILLILAILFSVASVVFNLNTSELKKESSSVSGEVVSGNPSGGINIVIEGNPNVGVGK